MTHESNKDGRRDKDPLQSTIAADTPTPGPSSQGHPRPCPQPALWSRGFCRHHGLGRAVHFHTQFFPNPTLNMQASPTQGVSCPPWTASLQTSAPTTAPHPARLWPSSVCLSLCAVLSGQSSCPGAVLNPAAGLCVCAAPGPRGCHSPVPALGCASPAPLLPSAQLPPPPPPVYARGSHSSFWSLSVCK